MIYVFGSSVQQADGYARVNDLAGARCFGNGSRVAAGLLVQPGDELYVLPGVSDHVLAVARRVLAKTQREGRPELQFISG